MRNPVRSSFCCWIALFCFGLCGVSSVFSGKQRPKNVQVAVRAKWAGTPLLLEAGELLSKEQKVLFWEFIYAWHNTENDDARLHSAKECIQKVFEYDETDLGNADMRNSENLKRDTKRSDPLHVLVQSQKALMVNVVGWTQVIFVDADQIVRADMGELYDMDLKGRPLAYTPFCDNNKEMDGYRFWRQGFWKDHLRGRPYHISALYVVDLKKFRQTAAGDNLRVFYENLSKDPNSLSNLDQDLPNYTQHTVPIFSLPQEWLWCESWCVNTTKAKAKTIDLCNNPMTKEPKLQGARRIVTEWPDLDLEARKFTAKILGDDSILQEPADPPSKP